MDERNKNNEHVVSRHVLMAYVNFGLFTLLPSVIFWVLVKWLA